jgi:hypothetical protein
MEGQHEEVVLSMAVSTCPYPYPSCCQLEAIWCVAKGTPNPLFLLSCLPRASSTRHGVPPREAMVRPRLSAMRAAGVVGRSWAPDSSAVQGFFPPEVLLCVFHRPGRGCLVAPRRVRSALALLSAWSRRLMTTRRPGLSKMGRYRRCGPRAKRSQAAVRSRSDSEEYAWVRWAAARFARVRTLTEL